MSCDECRFYLPTLARVFVRNPGTVAEVDRGTTERERMGKPQTWSTLSDLRGLITIWSDIVKGLMNVPPSMGV